MLPYRKNHLYKKCLNSLKCKTLVTNLRSWISTLGRGSSILDSRSFVLIDSVVITICDKIITKCDIYYKVRCNAFNFKCFTRYNLSETAAVARSL